MQSANDSLTRTLALEWGPDYGIRVNNLCPGPISGTPGMDKLSVKGNPEAWSSIPLQKQGEKWDCAMAAIYLASAAG
jgi:peroxisomal 2,4-dienoyl-CoA reductase